MIKKMTAVIMMAMTLTACGGSDDESDSLVSPTGDVARETRTLEEGTQLVYTLPKGKYRAEITSSNNGVDITWNGGSGCTNAKETKAYSGECSFTIQGQLVILNNTTFGLGGSEIVSIKVTAI